MTTLEGIGLAWDVRLRRDKGDLRREEWELVRNRFLGTLPKGLSLRPGRVDDRPV
jgi:hypothetical protein